jgi:hypothetical protein
MCGRAVDERHVEGAKAAAMSNGGAGAAAIRRPRTART